MARPTCYNNTTGPTPSVPKKPKPRSIPPPNEDPFGAQNKGPLKKTKARAAPKKSATSKKTPVKRSPLKKSPPAPKKAATGKLTTPTTKSAEITAAAWEAAKAASRAKIDVKRGDGGQVQAGNGVSKAAPNKRGRSCMEQSIMGQYLQQRSAISTTPKVSTAKASRKPSNSSVLVRPTATAKYDFAQAHNNMSREQVEKVKPAGARLHRKKIREEEEVKVFRVMDLPPKLRARIWREAVVRPRGFVWPEKDLTREQPDLAMTCRQVREEVLPIFYAENAFAINIVHSPAKKIQHRTGISTIQTWGRVLEPVGWFSMIRKWVLSYPGPGFKNDGKDDIGFMLAVTFSKRQHDAGFWDASIECHRDARCLLQGYEQYGICKVQTVPASVNDAVIAVTEAARGKSITAEVVYGMAKDIEEALVVVGDLRCEDVLKSIEI